jgi:hypothetical protein
MGENGDATNTDNNADNINAALLSADNNTNNNTDINNTGGNTNGNTDSNTWKVGTIRKNPEKKNWETTAREFVANNASLL